MTSIPGDKPETTQVSNFFVRGVTALLLLPVILFVIFTGGWLMALVIGLLGLLGLLEFYVFAQGRQSQGSALIGLPMGMAVILAFHFHSNELWLGSLLIGIALTFILETFRHPNALRQTVWQVTTTISGLLYIAFPMGFLIAIRAMQPNALGLTWIMTVCFVTWGSDTFAYLGGRFFGKTKLAPVLSPKKTVEGAIIGIFGGIIPATLVLFLGEQLTTGSFLLVCAGPFAAIGGDLFESALKRYFGVKDSHIAGLNIFPGHGGVLDRIDSLIWVTFLHYAYLTLSGILIW